MHSGLVHFSLCLTVGTIGGDAQHLVSSTHVEDVEEKDFSSHDLSVELHSCIEVGTVASQQEVSLFEAWGMHVLSVYA